MRVVIVESNLRTGRKVAGQIERTDPDADVLLYAEPDKALVGIAQHLPDVVLVAPSLGAVDGPQFVKEAQALSVSTSAKFVGMVDEPGPEWSARWVDAGATVVVQRPLDSVAVRMALRHRAGGVPG